MIKQKRIKVCQNIECKASLGEWFLPHQAYCKKRDCQELAKLTREHRLKNKID